MFPRLSFTQRSCFLIQLPRDDRRAEKRKKLRAKNEELMGCGGQPPRQHRRIKYLTAPSLLHTIRRQVELHGPRIKGKKPSLLHTIRRQVALHGPRIKGEKHTDLGGVCWCWHDADGPETRHANLADVSRATQGGREVRGASPGPHKAMYCTLRLLLRSFSTPIAQNLEDERKAQRFLRFRCSQHTA